MNNLRPNLGATLSFSIGVYILGDYTKYSLVHVARARVVGGDPAITVRMNSVAKEGGAA